MHDKSPSPFRSWKYSDSVGCLFLQASTSKTLHQRCFNFQFKFIELQADASLAPTLVDRSMFLFLLDNIYCLFNAAKRNLQKAGYGPNLTTLFTRCLLIVPQSVPPWVIMFTLTYKCILDMEFMICLSLSCKTICNKTWVLSFARLVVMSCAAPRKTTRLTSWDLESCQIQSDCIFLLALSYAFLGNSAKLSRSSQASAGGIQRHRRLGKAQPQERAAESRTETLLWLKAQHDCHG